MNLFQHYRNSFSGIHKNVWILACAIFINRAGSMVLAFSTLYLIQVLDFSKATTGIVMSCLGIGSILGSLLGGYLADRYNQKNIMVASLFASGIILFAILLTKNVYLIGIILFTYALVADTFRPSSSAQITANSTDENRTQSIALMRLAINLGMAIGPAIGGFIAFTIGYKSLYIIDGLTSVLAGIFLFITLAAKVQLKANAGTKKFPRSKSAYRDKPFIVYILIVALYAICFFQLMNLVPIYFKEVYHYNEKVIGYLFALNCMIVVVAEMPIVAYFDKKKIPYSLIAFGCICISVAYTILLLNNATLFLSVIYVVVITLSEIFAMPYMMNITLTRAPKDRQGQYSALYSVSYGIALTLAPMLGLGFADWFGFKLAFMFFIGLALILSIVFYQFRFYLKSEK
jgi:predicted MFS family arabinose efflux permease